MKRPSVGTCLTSEEKVKYLLQNGHRLKDKLVDKIKIKKQTIKDCLRNNTKEQFKLNGKSLRGELMIDDYNAKRKVLQIKRASEKGLNNNNVTVNDQNQLSPTTRSKRGKSVNNKKTQEKGGRKIVKAKCVDISKVAVISSPIFQCDYCKKVFNIKSSLRRHIHAHLDFQLYGCNRCPRKFETKANLLIHSKKMHPNTREHYMCSLCRKAFLSEKNMLLHMASHDTKENEFKCIYCDEEFHQQALLNQHEKKHLVGGKFLCTVCNTSYDCRTQLSLHIKSHLKIKDFVCQHCGKDFLRLNSLKRHVLICHAGHRIQCPICKKCLKGHLTEHMRVHEKQRPHICPECGQSFTQSTQLNVHRRSHTGARPYPCRICNRAFTHSNALMLHIRRHTGEKPFHCAMCPLTFSQLPHMKAHMRNIHKKEECYKCKKCHQFFKFKGEIENHEKSCTVGDKQLSFEEMIEASVKHEEIEVESVMSLSRMRFLLALLLTMIASKEKLRYLGFNKRLVDDLLVESLEAMGHKPCRDQKLVPLNRLRNNIQILLNGTVPKEQMEKFKKENKTTEELLELLTNEKKSS
ncbi:uncharacterized protein [Epargyreus clarus]